MVELVAHPRLLDRPEVQTFIRLHKAVAREITYRRYCYRDAKYSCYRIDHRAAEVGIRGNDLVVDVVGARPQDASRAPSRAAAPRLQRICAMRPHRRRTISPVAMKATKRCAGRRAASQRCQSVHCCSESD